MFAQQNQTNIVKNFSKLLFAFLFVCAFISPSKASANDYYFMNGTDWGDVGNWCDDINCDVYSSSLPGEFDNAYIYGHVDSNSGGPVSISSFEVNGEGNYIAIPITVYNGGVFNNGTFLQSNTSVTASTGLITFYGNSHNEGSIINGGITAFRDTSVNNSLNSDATVTGNTEFRDSSTNFGVVTGGIVDVYYPVSNPIGGDVSGASEVNYIGYPRNFIFTGESLDDPTDWGDLTNWYDDDLGAPSLSFPGPNDNATIAYYTYGVLTNSLGVTPEIGSLTVEYTSNPSEIGISIYANRDVVFNGNSFQTSASTITAPSITFNDSSYFEGTLNGDVYIGTTAYWAGGSPGSQGVYHVSANNWKGTVNGSLYFGVGDPVDLIIFEGSAVNEGSIPAGTAVQFNDSSYNTGVVSGNAYFNTDYYHQVYSHPTDVFLVNGRTWQGSVGTVYKDTYEAPVSVNSFDFINNSVNQSGINLPVTFSGDSSNGNSGTINGNVTFYDTSHNAGNITGDTTFSGNSSYNSGTITSVGAVNFMNASYNSGTITANVAFYDSSYLDGGTITGDAVFYGDYSEFQSGTVSSFKYRYYDTNTTTIRNFITNGPWRIISDGATVDVIDAPYDETTTFSQINGGLFIFPTHTFSYSAGANGSLTGSTTQIVVRYDDGSAVTAVPDSGYYFVNWSDASTDNPRTDLNASGDITVTANFAFSTTTPTVTTLAASSITTTTATLNGNITATGGANATVQGFNYGLSTSYTATTTDSGSFGTGTYSLGIESLTCGTTYHFRAFATNTEGTSYGSDETLTTSACAQSSTPTQSSSRSGTRSSSRSVVSNPVSPVVASTQSILDFLRQLLSTNTTITIPDNFISMPSAPVSGTPRNLTLLSIGADVTALQSFLIEQSVGPEGQKLALRGNTGYFGALTQAALAEYQKKNNIVPSTGYFGPITKAYLEKKGIAWWK